MPLRKLIAKLALRRKRAGYRSRFGGLWIDRLDAASELEARCERGELKASEAEPLRHWMAQGYVLLPQAVPDALTARIRGEVEAAWERADKSYAVEIGGERFALEPSLRSRHTKLLDHYARSSSVLEAAFAPPIRSFLRRIFERELLLFQSLTFERGSEQALHQDSAYVVVSRPLEFAAAWIALEDVQPGSGELEYVPGSQRFREFLFSGGTRNWNRERDGEPAHRRFLQHLEEETQRLGLVRQRFQPRRGDALIWSADLAHGGAPIQDPGLSRWSLVCHYCPADARPYYAAYRPQRRSLRAFAPGCWYASSHYDLNALGPPDAPRP